MPRDVRYEIVKALRAAVLKMPDSIRVESDFCGNPSKFRTLGHIDISPIKAVIVFELEQLAGLMVEIAEEEAEQEPSLAPWPGEDCQDERQASDDLPRGHVYCSCPTGRIRQQWKQAPPKGLLKTSAHPCPRCNDEGVIPRIGAPDG